MIRVEDLHFTPRGRQRPASFKLDGISLEVPDGAYCVLLGPTGSGKTLLLESVCGLNHPESGAIILHGDDVTRWRPGQRRIGYVPQDYALFAHKTVRKNITFAPRELAEAGSFFCPDRLMETLHIAHLADRYPERLSGGEKQRVALARALCSRPRLLVFDEPVSALDEQTRRAVLRELKSIQRATGITTLHVCHDFTEMMTVADCVAVLDNGRLAQYGTPSEILHEPATEMIARFVGSENVFVAEKPPRSSNEGPYAAVQCENGLALTVERARLEAMPDIAPGTPLLATVRPEYIHLESTVDDATLSPGQTRFIAFLQEEVDLGAVVRVLLQPTDEAISGYISGILDKKNYNGLGASLGDTLCVSIDARHVHLLHDDKSVA